MKRGFRHVFIVIESGDYWIRQDGFDGMPTTEVTAPAGYDLAAFYREDFTVLEITVERIPVRGLFMQATCVGQIKAYLALNAPFVFTPWQLYRHIVKRLEGVDK